MSFFSRCVSFIGKNCKILYFLQLTEVSPDNLSDSQILANWLENNDGNIVELIGKVEGPYSLIYLNRKQKYLWFCRDPLGRHSLLWKATDDGIFLSSVGHKSIPDLEEVPAVGLFCVHIDSSPTSEYCLKFPLGCCILKNKRIYLFR